MRPTLLVAALALLPISAVAQGKPSTRLTFGGPPPLIHTEAELGGFLDELEVQELALYEASVLETYYQWKGETHHYAGQVGRLISDLHSRKDYAAVLDRWSSRVTDSTLVRRLFLHRRDFLLARTNPREAIALVDVQTAVQDTLGQFRYDVKGQQVTLTGLSELIDTSADRELRRAAFTAMVQIAPHLHPMIDHAMGLIDTIGKQEGFPDGAASGLNSASLKPDQVLHDLDAFELATRPTYQAILERVKSDLKLDQLQPWDVDYWLHLQESSAGTDAWPKAPGLERMRALMRGLGFAVDSLPIDVKVWDVPTGGITFPVRPPFEARLLTNPFSGSDFYETLFHEYGHALNFTLIRSDLPPVFLQGDETPLGEGVAEALGHFAYDHHWLERAASLSPADAARLERVGKMQLMLWLRRSIALQAYTEISIYRSPAVDRDSLYRMTYRRFAGTALPAGDYLGTREFFATGPLYLQSYLYANMIATQLREAMAAEFGVEDLSADPRVAGWLTEHFFAPGASIPWPEKILRATGHPLSTDALARYLKGAE